MDQLKFDLLACCVPAISGIRSYCTVLAKFRSPSASGSCSPLVAHAPSRHLHSLAPLSFHPLPAQPSTTPSLTSIIQNIFFPSLFQVSYYHVSASVSIISQKKQQGHLHIRRVGRRPHSSHQPPGQGTRKSKSSSYSWPWARPHNRPCPDRSWTTYVSLERSLSQTLTLDFQSSLPRRSSRSLSKRGLPSRVFPPGLPVPLPLPLNGLNAVRRSRHWQKKVRCLLVRCLWSAHPSHPV